MCYVGTITILKQPMIPPFFGVPGGCFGSSQLLQVHLRAYVPKIDSTGQNNVSKLIATLLPDNIVYNGIYIYMGNL